MIRVKKPDKDLLVKLYIDDNLTREEVGEYFNAPDYTVKRWLKSYDVVKSSEAHHKNINRIKLKRYGQIGYNNPEKCRQTNQERYGVDCVFELKSIQERSRNTMQERYKSGNFLSSEEFKKEKKKYFIDKFGVDHYSKTLEFKQRLSSIAQNRTQKEWDTICAKRILTNIKKYGVEHYSSSVEWLDKVITKNRQKYGADWYLGSQSRKERLFTDDEIQKQIESYKNTCQFKYGVPFYSMTEEYKSAVRNTNMEQYGVPVYTQSQEYKQKSYETKKKNGTLGKSKEEDLVFDLLKEKYSDVKRHYKSEVYPFACDFYIPDINVYIEYQAFWTHGKEPFDETSPKHLQIIEDWKKRNTTFYNDAIKTWTERDTQKRNIAKENNLNYYELKTVEDVINFLKEH